MRRILFSIIFIWIFTMIVSQNVVLAHSLQTVNGTHDDKGLDKRKINKWIQTEMKKGKIPGLSVSIVDGGKTLYQKGFGYEDYQAKKPVTTDTLFELGSTTKAFTGLAILQLQQQGLLKLSDPVTKYVPWFKMKYKGEYNRKKINKNVSITIGQLLYQTSGIPFKSIKDIPITQSNYALATTVKTMIRNEKLDFYPGEKFQYATINYDILGLIIENVSGISYEQYINQNILKPYGLNSTYLFRQEAQKHDMATGYKLGFFRPLPYHAPIYRGDKPAGYIISNARDISRWLKIQNGSITINNAEKKLIAESHLPDRTVFPSSDGSSYAAGWSVYQKENGMLAHEGSNPNYSSYFIIYNKKIGIGVQANIDSSYTKLIAEGILSIIQDEDPVNTTSDFYKNVDTVSTVVIILLCILNILLLTFLLKIGIDMWTKKRKISALKLKHIAQIFTIVLFLGIAGYCVYIIPDVLFSGLTWNFVKVWAPFSFIPAVWMAMATVVLYVFYFFIIFLFPKENEKPIFPLIILSSISGFGNTLIIFSVTVAIQNIEKFNMGLLIYFVLGIIVYVIGQKLIRNKMINFTNNLVYDKRMKLIDSILSTPFYRLEKINKSEIYNVLQADAEVISNTPAIIVQGLTNLVTLVCCLVYLGFINIFGLIISVAVIVAVSGCYYLVGRKANAMWEQSRNIQNLFFSFLRDMIEGFKELILDKKKRTEFAAELDKSNIQYKEKKIMASIQFTNAFVIGELLFVIVIGTVAFIFPILFKNIDANALRTYVFIFLYMTGPVNGVLNVIPQMFRIRVSWDRVVKMNKGIGELAEQSHAVPINEEVKKLNLQNVYFEYKKENEVFQVGPIDLEFCTGEITFITGGNGSGKTTLAKLITGLYKPDQGDILLNGQQVNHSILGEQFSNVFSEFYLFKKLYGVDTLSKEKDIKKYLKILNIEDKVRIENGEFSSLDLSTGQRKRLALLVSYLEDKPFYLFDEWAADQDPQFRKFFYEYLLFDLKRNGKCVIVITHDDRYFDLADQLVKMSMGRIELVTKVQDIHIHQLQKN